MATEKLIIIDIAILMGSQSQQVFMEQVDLYPGARHVYDVMESFKCNCDDGACTRRSMQYILGEATGGDKEVAANFIEEAQSIHSPRELKELVHNKFHERESKNQEDSILDLLRRSGISIIGE